MILNQAENIMLGSTEVQKIYLGTVLIWERGQSALGLPPYGTRWKLFGIPSYSEHYFIPHGIHLKGLTYSGYYIFVCAESPQKIDFTRIKSITATYQSFRNYVQDATPAIGTIAYDYSETLVSPMYLSSSKALPPEETSGILDCRSVGGENFLIMYTDKSTELNVTNLQFEYYPAGSVLDLSSAGWEQRNFQWESTVCITCTQTVDIPDNSYSELAVHIGMHSGKAIKCCVAFLDENGTVVDYGDGWQGTMPHNGDVSTHFQAIPEQAKKLQIAVGYAPDMTETIQTSDLKSCILCFS